MNLHGKLMNLQVQTNIIGKPAIVVHSFKRGHKDARHAAAEMVVSYDRICNAMAMALEYLLDDYKDACLDWTPENQERGQELIALSKFALASFKDLE